MISKLDSSWSLEFEMSANKCPESPADRFGLNCRGNAGRSPRRTRRQRKAAPADRGTNQRERERLTSSRQLRSVRWEVRQDVLCQFLHHLFRRTLRCLQVERHMVDAQLLQLTQMGDHVIAPCPHT